jgi:hypothetical protein
MRRSIFRCFLGTALIAISLWGISLCNSLFQKSLLPGGSPPDQSAGQLGAWASWFLFFSPIALSGLWLLQSALRKMGAFKWFGERISARGQHPAAVSTELKQQGAPTASHPRSLEGLSPETAALLQRKAARAAKLIGLLASLALVGSGACGLAYLLFFSAPYSGSSVYAALATGRVVTGLAVASGTSLLLGLVLLRRTFARESAAWLVPLHAFSQAISRRWHTTPQARPSTPRAAKSKQLP